MDKCAICRYEDIHFVMFHGMIVQKCSKCGVIRIPVNSYDSLMYNCAYERNIGGIKKAMRLSDLSEKKLKQITTFNKIVSFNSFRLLSKKHGECNSCRDNMILLFNLYDDHFKICYCNFCNVVYFDEKRFDEFLDLAVDRSTGFSLIKIIKEIFHRGMKNNVKK